MTDHTDLDQAREWIDADEVAAIAENITAASHGFPPEYQGKLRTWAKRLRASLPPAPLPDPLFLAKATHLDHGEGIVFSHFPDEDGEVRFMSPEESSGDGTLGHWVKPSTLTFHTPETPDHPEYLETEQDYENAPEGTIVAQDEGKPFVLIDELWRNPNPWRGGHGEMASLRRRVLRWGWEA